MRSDAAILVVWLAVALGLLAAPAPAVAQNITPQDQQLIDLPISGIRFEGLSRVTDTQVRNTIRTAVGMPYDPATVRDDVALLNRLGEFKDIAVDAEKQPDGTIVLIYRFVEQAIINDVQVVGNKLISDQELREAIGILPGSPLDNFRIQNAVRKIQKMYQDRGHYLTSVTVDEKTLSETGVLIFAIIEGPRVRVRAVEFEGNDAFDDDRLYSEIKTRTSIFLFRRGELDQEQLVEDVAALVKYYKDRGYLDIRVDRRIELSPDNREAKVVFVVAEGRQYILRSVRAIRPGGKPLEVFSQEEIAAILTIRPGDVYSLDKLNKSIKAVQEAYGLMGYIDVAVQQSELRTSEQPEVDLQLEVNEGRRYVVGLVTIIGNTLTKDRVIRHLVRLKPGEPFDAREVPKSEERLRKTRLYGEQKITVQDATPEDPEHRDVVVEVKETNTGSFNFGVAFGSDTGAFGTFSLNQRNFDASDPPESWDELIHGRAFRGGGQRFNLSLAPGENVSEYGMSLTEPHIFDTDTSVRGSVLYRNREYDEFDEQRASLSGRVGRQFGEVWDIGVTGRAERVELTNIDNDAPQDLFDDAGPNNIIGIGIGLTRTTIGTIRKPDRGSRLEVGIEQVGLGLGDFTFTSANVEYTVYLKVDEDFLGRASTLKLTGRTSYIFLGDAPIFEKYYLGGRNFRGFEFRQVSPKGIRHDTGELGDDPVGGNFLFFLGAQYEFPIFQDVVSGVTFIDTGTVTEDIGLTDYRVSVGAGLRLYIPQFGEAPIAIDFGFPLLKQEGDQTQTISFSIELPFD